MRVYIRHIENEVKSTISTERIMVVKTNKLHFTFSLVSYG